jgi:hypothetical protein
MPGVPNTPSPGHLRDFPAPGPTQANRTITGVTRNATGVALGGSMVCLFSLATWSREQWMVSDGSGNYSFTVDPTMQYFTVEYLVGSPDVAGTSKQPLVGT